MPGILMIPIPNNNRKPFFKFYRPPHYNEAVFFTIEWFVDYSIIQTHERDIIILLVVKPWVAGDSCLF